MVGKVAPPPSIPTIPTINSSVRSSKCVMRMSWQSRPKDFFTDAPDAIIEVDTLGRNAYEAAKVTVGTEGDPCARNLI